MDMYTHTHIDPCIHQADRQADGQTDRQTCIHTYMITVRWHRDIRSLGGFFGGDSLLLGVLLFVYEARFFFLGLVWVSLVPRA